MSLDRDLLTRSFDLVLERAPNLTERFYEILFERYPSLRPLFGGRVKPAQARMLREALAAVLAHLDDGAWLTETLGAMGARHVGYGVTDAMYAQVGDALIAAMAEAAGEDWSPEIEAAWVAAYGAVASLMQDGARRAVAA